MRAGRRLVENRSVLDPATSRLHALNAQGFAGLTTATDSAGRFALAAVPAAMAVREWAREFSIRDCAIHLDRLLGLEERLSTAIEAPGSMGPVLLADAAGALTRAALPSHRLPREGRLLAGSLLLLAALFAIPSPGRSGRSADPAFEAVADAEAAKLLALAKTDVRFQEAADSLKNGRPEEALALLEALRLKYEEQLLQGAGASAEEVRKLLDQAASSAAAVSAELARMGRTVHAPPPAVARAKLERQKSVEPGAAPAGTAAASGQSSFSADIPWNPRYDPVIRRYFGRTP